MRRLFLLFLMLSFIMPAFLFAQNRQSQQKRNSRNLNQNPEMSVLDEDQKKEWQKIRIDFQKQKNDLKAKLKNARLDLKQLMNDQRVPDENAVNNKLDEIAGYSLEQQKLSHHQQIKFRKLINDEQWQQIQEFKKKRVAMKRRDRLNQRNLRRPNRNL